MNKMKWLTLFVAIALVLSACGGKANEGGSTSPASGSPSASSSSPSPNGNGDQLQVAMVTSGSLGDNGIFDMAAEGLKQAEQKFGIASKVLEAKQDPSLYMNLLQSAADGYDLIFVNPGYQFEETLSRIAPQFPDKTFVYMDGILGESLDNVVSMTTKDHEGSYLAGMLAAGMTTQTDVKGINEDKKIGGVGAIDAPTINNFVAGYKQGATAVEADIDVKVLYAGAFDNPAKGQELGLALLNQKADVLFNIASLTGTGMLQAAQKQGNYAIGVDVDQCAVHPGNVLASMMKRFDTGAYLMVEKMLNNELKGGDVYSFGLKDNGVELKMCEETKDIVPTALVEQIEEAKQKIIDGTIVVEQVKD